MIGTVRAADDPHSDRETASGVAAVPKTAVTPGQSCANDGPCTDSHHRGSGGCRGVFV